jgi:hypothetical protein
MTAPEPTLCPVDPFPLEVRYEYRTEDKPRPDCSGRVETQHTGEIIVVVKCGEETYRFSNWHGRLP